MSGALLGSLSCARCARILPADDQYCTLCGARQVDAASGGALSQGGGLLAGVVQAAAPRRRAALAIDLSAVLVVGAAAGAATGVHSEASTVLAAVAGVVLFGAIQLLVLGGTGRTLGMRVLDLRSVDNLSALPPHVFRTVSGTALRWRPRATLTADLRRGRDPLSPALAPIALAETRVSAGSAPSEAPRPTTTGEEAPQAGPVAGRRRHGARSVAVEVSGPVYRSVRILFDSGDEVALEGPLLVGRNPETDASSHPVHALPDLSRSLSRTHALLDWRDGLLWVTDLNTTNGSAVVDADGGVRPLVPGLRTAASIGWRVELGERSFEIQPGVPA